MRLLHLEANGDVSCAEHVGTGVPPYAILSHCWGEDYEEVSFKDLVNKTYVDKKGFTKLTFCATQAFEDGLHFFWIDTCCIDKSSSAELSEAINSMYQWYAKASKCYAYLSDVQCNDSTGHDTPQGTWREAFKRSRWFTRGWTLQELLAPASVRFYSSEGILLGDRLSLLTDIHDSTGISVKALQGEDMSFFNVNERMSWAQNRKTKREEDRAYSLLGIFKVHLPLIYGEGEANAFKRLEDEINRPSKNLSQLDTLFRHLPCAKDAPFNAYAKQHEPICQPGTRVDLLQEIYNWVDGNDKHKIFWLNGLAGTGKSTIARTIAHTFFEQRRLAASFFFARGGGDVSNAKRFVTSIALQLAQHIPSLLQHIYAIVTEHSDIGGQSLRDQWNFLIESSCLKLDWTIPYVLVIDALDECDDENDVRLILRFLAQLQSHGKIWFRVILTSRPEVAIRHGFNQMSQTEHQDFVLHRIAPTIVDHDIKLYIEYNFQVIAQERGLSIDWPGVNVILQLVQSANGLFIWAATACRFVRDGKRFAAKRLNSVLHSGKQATTAPEKHLDEIYTTVLMNSIHPSYTKEESEEQCERLRHVLGSIVVLRSPLSLLSLDRLLHVEDESVGETLDDLHAIVAIPDDQSQPLRLHHPSFREFLLDKGRCTNTHFWVDEKQAHRALLDECLQLMSASLKKDICDVHAPGAFAAEVSKGIIEQHISQDLQYACLYWIEHFERSGETSHTDDGVHRFLEQHFLHWLETLSWIGKVKEGINSIRTLELINKESELFYDMRRFTLYHQMAIMKTPLQLYCGAVVFTPAASLVRNLFHRNRAPWIIRLPEVDTQWNAILQVLEGHQHEVNAVEFSHDGRLLASVASDMTVKLWDANTGVILHTMLGHRDVINSVAFSSDSSLLATCAEDRLTIIWDVATGAIVKSLSSAADTGVYDVAFSPDDKILALASTDHTVKLWDVKSGKILDTLKGHLAPVYAVNFSPDGILLASSSEDEVKLWDMPTRQLRRTLSGHSWSVMDVAFSQHNDLLVSASEDDTARVWDVKTGKLHHSLLGHDQGVLATSFSPDSSLLATGSEDKTAKLWNPSSGINIKTFKGHTRAVTGVAFNRDGRTLASSSSDKSVIFWDTLVEPTPEHPKDHIAKVIMICFSSDGRLLASGSEDKTIRVWQARTGSLLSTLKLRSPVWALHFSPSNETILAATLGPNLIRWDFKTVDMPCEIEGISSSILDIDFSMDGSMIASASENQTIKLSHAGTGILKNTLVGHSGPVVCVKFSPDSTLLASCAYDQIRVWDTTTGAGLRSLVGHIDTVRKLAFSPSGELLVSASDTTIKLWDASTGRNIHTLTGHTSSITGLAFLPNRQTLASCSLDRTIKLWNVLSKEEEEEFTFQDDSHMANVEISPDGRFLLSISPDGDLKLLDIVSRKWLYTFLSERLSVRKASFSPDSQLLASISFDKTVKVWDLDDGSLRWTLRGHTSIANALAWAPGGKVLASSSRDETIKLWDISTGTLIRTIYTHSRFYPLLYPDGSTTNEGLSNVPEDAPTQLSVQERWILHKKERKLWLPSEYQPSCSAVYGNLVALGHESGKISFIEFDFESENEEHTSQ
ncbi:WD40 repeat-like protein [Pyrenochaeta sp. DS3sAY3a]|nr:WD40 repeat-like protein [Pyrenochaeta sp. DS3sAY3a]